MRLGLHILARCLLRVATYRTPRPALRSTFNACQLCYYAPVHFQFHRPRSRVQARA